MLTMPKQGWLKRQTNNFQRSMNVMLAGALMLGSTVGLLPQNALATETSDHVVINEISPSPSGGSEWVELYNPTGRNVDLAGWTIKDASNPPQDISGTIDFFGHATFDVTDLNNTGDTVTLSNAAGEPVDTVTYSVAIPTDNSYGRSYDRNDAFVVRSSADVTKNTSNPLAFVEPQIVNTAPAASETVSGTYTLSASVDTEAINWESSRVAFKIDGSGVGTVYDFYTTSDSNPGHATNDADGNKVFNLPYDMSSLSSGSHTLTTAHKYTSGTLTVTTDTETVNFTVGNTPTDTEGPVITNTTPDDSDVISGTDYTVSANVSDASGVTRVSYSVNARGAATDGNGIPQETGVARDFMTLESGDFYTATLDTTSLPTTFEHEVDGSTQTIDVVEYKFTFTAVDSSGNVNATIDHVFDVKVDNSADTPAPAFTEVSAGLYDTEKYKGITVNFSFENLKEVAGIAGTVHRASGGDVVKTAKQSAIDYGNARIDDPNHKNSLSMPIVIQEGTYDEQASRAWVPVEGETWNVETVPQSVTVRFDFTDGTFIEKTVPVESDGVNYADLLPPAPLEVELYKNGFETGISAWVNFGGTIERVASNTNGTASSSGDYHALVNGSVYTNWGGYANQFPLNGYTTEVDVYLDMSKADSNDNYIDFSSAINGQDGKHQRDFIFHVGHDPANSRWSATVSNNSSHSQSDTPHLSGSNLASITETGWYTLQSYFHSNDSGEFAVDMKIIDMNENVVGSWTLSSPSDVIATEIGGNRYGWFAEQPFTDLPIDNSCLYLGDPAANGCGFVTEEPDNKDPVVAFLAPKDGGVVDNLKASVKIEDKTNVTQYSFRVDGPGDLYWTTYKTRPDKKSVTVTDYNLCENAHGFDCELNELPDGKYRVSVLAYDGQGNDSRENKGVEFFLDTTGPKAEFTKPSNDSLLPATVKLQLELAAQGKAGLGQQHIELKSDNFKVWWKYNVETGDKRSNAGFGTINYSGDERSGTLTITFDRSKLENGTYHGRSFAKDKVGNRSVAYYSEVVADNTDPGIDFVTPSRFDNTTYDRYFQSLSEIKIKGTDEHGVKSTVVHIYNANGSISTAWCGAAIPGDTGSCDTSSLADGDYYVKVAATDSAGNSNYATKHFTIDSTPPEQVKGLAFYDDNGLVSDGITSDYSVTAKWDAVNDAAKHEYCYWNDIATSTYREANCYNTFPTTNQQSGNLNQGEGAHYVKVRAIDAAGNKGEWSETVALVYDKTAPTLGLTAPAKTVNGDWVDVKGYVFDRNFSHYYCYLTKDGVSGEVTSATDEVGHGCVTTWASDVRGNAGNWHTDYPTGTVQSKADTTGSKLGELDIRGLSDGNYTVHLVGIDRAGNQEAATTSFTIDNDNLNTDDNGELVGTPKPAVPNKDGEFTPGALYFMWVACYNYLPGFPNCDQENAVKPLAGEINYGAWKDDTYDLRVFSADPAEETDLSAALTIENTDQTSYNPKAGEQTLAGPGDYWWQVRACDELSSNCSEWSTPTRFTLLEVGGRGGNTGQFSPASRQTGLAVGAPLGTFATSGGFNPLAGDAASSQANSENEQQNQTGKKDGGSEVIALNTSSGGDSDKKAVAGAKDSNVSSWWWLLLLVPAVGYYIFRRSQSEEPAN